MEFERIIADVERLNFIIEVLKAQLPEGAEVLDVGCGNASYSRTQPWCRKRFSVKGMLMSVRKRLRKAKSLNNVLQCSF